MYGEWNLWPRHLQRGGFMESLKMRNQRMFIKRDFCRSERRRVRSEDRTSRAMSNRMGPAGEMLAITSNRRRSRIMHGLGLGGFCQQRYVSWYHYPRVLWFCTVVPRGWRRSIHRGTLRCHRLPGYSTFQFHFWSQEKFDTARELLYSIFELTREIDVLIFSLDSGKSLRSTRY